MTTIKVRINTKYKKFCGGHCPFFVRGVMSDWCDMYGLIKRVDQKHYISLRSPECHEAEINEE